VVPLSESKLLVRSFAEPKADGQMVCVTPRSAGWGYVGFEVYRLARGVPLDWTSPGHEVCAVMLSGRADVSYGREEWPGVGGRTTVFDGVAESVYAPPGGTLKISPVTDGCEVALCWAPAKRGSDPALIRAADVKSFQRGSGMIERTIHNILMEDRPAESLLVTEVLTPGGHWSSYPPHKHDTDDLPREAYLEETYYHRFKRPEGFAVQLVYTDDRSLDEALQVRDGDVVLIPRGYHPVSAGPGYDLYYLNVMAGPVRRWQVTTDPDHRWQA
jgi:5-deoxy-glucuronate isomerase